jgi:hypothetical protein
MHDVDQVYHLIPTTHTHARTQEDMMSRVSALGVRAAHNYGRHSLGVSAPVRFMMACQPTRATATSTPTSDSAAPSQTTVALAKLPTQALVDALWVQGWPPAMIQGSRAMAGSTPKIAGRAVTLRFGNVQPVQL